MNRVRVRLLGVRGSVPVHDDSCAVFGGATSCVLYQAGEETVILDAGTGILWQGLPSALTQPHFTLLLTHAHVDHIIGLPMFPPLFDPRRSCDVYLRTREGHTAREQIELLMAPPLWPVRTGAMRAQLCFHDVPAAFSIGPVNVESLEVRHPGGATAYKLTWQGVSVVYATDAELEPEDLPGFCRFAGGCDLLLLDAQYTEEEYRNSKGFGHMPVSRALEVAARCGAGQTMLVHHAPARTDAQLSAWNQELEAKGTPIRFGRAGGEWTSPPLLTSKEGD